MPYVSPEQWVPVGIDSLESAADEVVRLQQSTLVVAGPGAGKTELLAQRACFLLQTGICPPPHRILSISFKRDAAKNLKERVHQRCGNHADRFDSFTLDAFSKSLVDRFMPALTEEWRPKLGYEVMTRMMRVEEMVEWFEHAGVPEGHASVNVRGMNNDRVKRLFDRMAHGEELPYSKPDVNVVVRHWGLRWWHEQLSRPPATPALSFPMLNRLAAFLLRQNPKIMTALRSTYCFVFLDEFQDTTAAQYDLIRAAFQGSPSLLTAVGDNKQRIMLWAGAMADVFEAYEKDFGAKFYHLVSNYRSAPELVRMQHIIAQALEAGTPPAMAAKVKSTGSCVLLEFSNPEDEAVGIVEVIKEGIREGKKPRDFCILVRQRTGEMIEPLKTALAEQGITLRDESQLQDLLAEPVTKFLLAILRLATRPRDPEAWETITSEVALLKGLDENGDSSSIEQEAKRLIQHAAEGFKTGGTFTNLLSELTAMVGYSALKSVYRQYLSGSYLKDTVDGLATALESLNATSGSARKAVDELIGSDVVPAMTIHKSKGLEFNTVIFLGLEDSQWWAFANQADEEKRGFFVAFSRAIEHVFFTFSDIRDERWGRMPQRKAKIGDLFTILQQAGVETVDFRGRKLFKYSSSNEGSARCR